MARQTTKKKTETPEKRADIIAEEIKKEGGIDALRAELDRYILAVREKDAIIKSLVKDNEQLSHELSEARNK